MWQHSLWVHSGPAHILEASGSLAIRPSDRSRGGRFAAAVVLGLGGSLSVSSFFVRVCTHMQPLMVPLGLEFSATFRQRHPSA